MIQRPAPRSRALAGLLLAALALGGCANTGQGGFGAANKETAGTLLGAGLGGLLGSRIGGGSGNAVATLGGVILGGFVGNEIGKSLDNADRAAMQARTIQTLEREPSGKRVAWSNPDSGHGGWVEARPAKATAQGDTCREFTQTVVIGGKEQQAYGTACRQADGSWKIVQN